MKQYKNYFWLLTITCAIQANQTLLFDHFNAKGQNYLNRLIAARNCVLNPNAYNIYSEHNGDDTLALFAGSFTKTLEHNTQGLLTTNGAANYKKLVGALNSGYQQNFNAISRAPGATIKFVNPQAAFARSLIGTPATLLPIASAPQLSSAQAAADIIEVYLKQVARNVRFADYGTGMLTDSDAINTGSITANAALILTDLGDAYKGPREGGIVTPNVLFRGPSAGDLVGPFISQFLYLPTHRLFMDVAQPQMVQVAQPREFGVARTDFVVLQNGTVPRPYDATDFSGERLIVTGKDSSTAVHNDAPGEFYFNAINILLYNGAPPSPDLPYQNGNITNEVPFITMFVADYCQAIFVASQEALKHAWAHKWLGNRRLRPEAMAGLIDQAQLTGLNPYNLHQSLFVPHAGINLLDWVNAINLLQSTILNNPLTSAEADTYLLAQVYPESCPAHPSYPAGHATIAGACATVIKAFFNDDALISSFVTPVKPDPADPTSLIALTTGEGADLLTIGGELNKMATNIAGGRDFAGIHYRSDGEVGIALGEQVALAILQNLAQTYNEQGFNGYTLRKFNGQRVRVIPEGVIPIAG